MSKFNKILDPNSGLSYTLDDKKATDILQKYSDISGRTKRVNDDFFKFREYEFLTMTNKIYPFLTTIMNKDKIAPYVNKYLGKFSKHNLNEVNMKRYKETFLEFENHIDNLISNLNQKKMYTRT